ncbi:hypothetical protein BGX38DRAFT_1271717 [Terfezia claveryi]|nr:hypothetical protein BGX38DRAFT_1271717 [Terfezia claveryi]
MGQSELQKFLDLVSDPYRDQFNQQSILASIASSLATSAIIFLAWCLIRPHNSIVYAPKLRHLDEKHAPRDLVDKIGVDATLFLRVLKMCRNIMGILGLLGVILVIPVNVLISKKNSWVGAPTDPLILMTPRMVWGEAIWSQVVVAWVFDAIIVYMLWVNYKAVAKLRQGYFESPEYQVALSSRTLMVTDIPVSHRSDEGLRRILNGITTPSNGDENCVIGRAVKDLPGLIEQHSEAVYELEEVLAKYLKNPNSLPASRPTCKPQRHDKSIPKGMKVDAIDYLYHRIDGLEKKIYHIRDTVDSRDAEKYGFISYPTISQAHVAAKAVGRKHIKGTTIQLAPKPQDLIWENLLSSKKHRRWNAMIGNLLFGLLSIGFVVPNAFIAVFLSDISRIAEFWPAFRNNFYGYPKEWAFVQGFLTPVVTSIIYLLLPIVMRRLSKWQGDLKKTSRERHVTHKLYAFFIFNNLIIFSIFSTLWELVARIVGELEKQGNVEKDVWKIIQEYKVATQLTTAIFKVSPFWMMYLLQRNMGAVLDLAQVVSLLWGTFARKWLCPTPRQIIEHTAPPTFDYATYYNYFLFYFTIALTFATLQPLMLIIAFLYFLVDSWLKKYLLMYVFVTKIESGGAFWRLLFNRFLFATIFSNVVVAIVVWVQYDASMAWAWVIPLPFLLMGFKIYCKKTFDDNMHYHTKAGERDSIIAGAGGLQIGKDHRRSEKLRTRFGHPALYRPLLHPMVRANAQRVLAEVYQGRTNSDMGDQRRTVYGEIDLDAMERGRPGKKLGEPAGGAAVQFVEDGDMDFSKWKHKPGFAEEGAEILSLRGSTYGGSGWMTPTPGISGFRGVGDGVDSGRSSLEGGADMGYHGVGKRHDFGERTRPQSPLSSGFTSVGYQNLPVYTSSPGVSRSPSPNPLQIGASLLPAPHPHSPQDMHFQPLPPRDARPLHMHPPHSPGMLASGGEYSDAHSVHSHMSGESMSENLLAGGGSSISTSTHRRAIRGRGGEGGMMSIGRRGAPE